MTQNSPLTNNIIKYFHQQEFEKIILILEKKIEESLAIISDYHLLGIAYLLKNDCETAQALWMSILWETENPDMETKKLIQTLEKVAYSYLQNNQVSQGKLIYEQILNFDENNLNNYLRLIDIYLYLQETEEAEKLLHNLIHSDLVNPTIYIKYSNLLLSQYNYLEIIETLKIAINQYPEEQELYFYLMLAFRGDGRAKEAIEIAERGIALNPNNLLFKMENMRIFPIVYESEKEIEFYNKRFTNYLDTFLNNLKIETELEKKEALKSISLFTNFYLAYQGKSIINLQKKYANLVSQIMKANHPNLRYTNKNQDENNKIKVGYISSKMFDNVIGELFVNWLEYHDQNKFQIYSYYLGKKEDQLTLKYQKNSFKFLQFQGNIEKLCQIIIEDKLDILVFLDLGMSAELMKIAGLKLAPIQCKAWGPPITSGSPMIDYFLTSDLMEHPEGEKEYSEKLIRLPNLAFSYSPPQFPEIIKNRNDFNLPKDAVIYWSSQSLFKYLPQYDYIFAEIGEKVSNSKFIFIEFPLSEYVNDLFKKRLEKVFAQKDLHWQEYCIFSPSLSQEDFLNMMLLADVGLDTFGWSGGKTALEALSCNLPVVTCPGGFMRGRHSYGILKMLGVEDSIASSEQEYIDIAVRLGVDQEWREEIREKIKANHHNLYEDLECVRGLEKFYQDVVKGNMG